MNLVPKKVLIGIFGFLSIGVLIVIIFTTPVDVKSFESADEEYNAILVDLKECADKQAKDYNIDHCTQGIDLPTSEGQLNSFISFNTKVPISVKSFESADEEYNVILVDLKECADKQAKGYNVDHCPQGISDYQIEYEIYSYGDGSYAKALDNVVFQIISGDNKCIDTKQILKDLKNVVDSYPNAPQIDFFAEQYEKAKNKYDNNCSGLQN